MSILSSTAHAALAFTWAPTWRSESTTRGWWGEGEFKFFIDDDEDYPTICGTGLEDYFCGAYDFNVPGRGYTTTSAPFVGLSQVLKPDGLYFSQQRFGMYRWHLLDPYCLRQEAEGDRPGFWLAGRCYLHAAQG